jgi:hypothetical protein
MIRRAALSRRQRTPRKPTRWRPSVTPRVENLEERTVPSTWTVTSPADSGDGSLRAVIAAAQDGDQIIFDQSLQGQTITLTSGELAVTKSLDIEGLGADQLAVSGNHQSRVFDVTNAVTVTIAGLTIRDGLAVGGPGAGGGIEIVGANVTVANDTLADNEARGFGGNGHGRGGALDAGQGAMLTVVHCLFRHNQATGTSEALGGAIYSGPPGSGVGATATVIGSTFLGNQTIGGSGSIGENFSRAGAIYSLKGPLTVEDSTFIGNQALGGSDSVGGALTGEAAAGAIQNSDQSTLFLSGSVFRDN